MFHQWNNVESAFVMSEKGKVEEDSDGDEEGVSQKAGITGLDTIGVGVVTEECGGYRPLRPQGSQPTGTGEAQKEIERTACKNAE